MNGASGNTGNPATAAPPPGEAYYTTNSGCPVLNPQATLRVGNQLKGLHLIRDINLLETISHATHERIPERVVHAKGAGAYGIFEPTNPDIWNSFTDADFLRPDAGPTRLFARFSTVAGGRGSADTVRDTRGFAFKIYTEEGNLDWLFFSEPVFPIRDGAKFPSFMHAQKARPGPGLFNSSTFWDFFNNNSEAYHALMMIFSDRGTPSSYQESEIFGINTYKFTKLQADKTVKTTFVKIHMKPGLGVKNMNRDAATQWAGMDPDHFSRKLAQAIQDGTSKNDPSLLPSWDVYAQLIPFEDADKPDVPLFDPTRVLSQQTYPLVQFGKITLNENNTNFFAETESVSFSPTAIVPGWDVSADPILQTRLFAYGTAARYRLGVNFYQTYVNAPKYQYNPTKRDGFGAGDNQKDLPNYIPGDQKIEKPIEAKQYELAAQENWTGMVTSYDSPVVDDDFVQPRALWNDVLSKDKSNNPPVAPVKIPSNPEDTKQPDPSKYPPLPVLPASFSSAQQNLVYNVSSNLGQADDASVRQAAYAVFTKIDPTLGAQVQAITEWVVTVNSISPAPAAIHHLL